MKLIRNNYVLTLALLPLLCFSENCLPAADKDKDVSLLEQTGQAFAKVAKEATPAVVFIKVEKTIDARTQGNRNYYYNNPFDYYRDDFFKRYYRGQDNPSMPNPHQFKQQGAGSGFLISKDGYILTNNHVVGDADKITVRLNDGREFEAELKGADPKSEVAVIKIKADNLPEPLEMGNSETLQIGEWVIAIGNPFEFFTGSVTVGIVSAKGRSNLNLDQVEYEDFIQTDAAINPGNSGGPLLDVHGKVIGINTAIVSNNGGYMGLGFAIPINMAKAIKDQLIETGKVVRGYLGIHIQEVTTELAAAFDLDTVRGILIAQVQEGSAADKSGLQAEDIIIKLDGKDVKSVNVFRNTVASNPPGSKLTLTIIRNGKTMDIKAVTAAMEDLVQENAPSELYDKLGMTVDELTSDIARRLGHRTNEGVLVSNIDPEGLAAGAGITRGSVIKTVNKKKISTVAEFMDALKISDETRTVLLLVKPDAFSYFYVTINID